MKIIAVESTTLSTIAYDEARDLLQLEFCSGAIYQYFDVPAAMHAELLHAPSKGRYFNQVIRGRFSYARAAGAQTGACCPTLLSESSQ